MEAVKVTKWEQLDAKQTDKLGKLFSSVGLTVTVEATPYHTISSLILTAKNGVRIKISNVPTVHREVPPVKTRYYVRGKLKAGLTVDETFDTREEKDKRYDELNELADGYGSLEHGSEEVELEPAVEELPF